MESLLSLLRRHWDQEPTPNPSHQEGNGQDTEGCLLPSWEGSGVGRFTERPVRTLRAPRALALCPDRTRSPAGCLVPVIVRAVCRRLTVCVGLFGWIIALLLTAQETAQFSAIQSLAGREMRLEFSAPAGRNYRIEVSTNLLQWESLLTLSSQGLNEHTDSATPYFASRIYRAFQLDGANILTGDHLPTDNGDVIFHPINHATLIMSWNGKMIYNDPVGDPAAFQGIPRADLILISHAHGDHFSNSTLGMVTNSGSVILSPLVVYNGMPAALKILTRVMTNGAITQVMGLTIEAVPAYNLTSSYHPKGVGNGYVLTLGGRRVYLSGDSEDIPEMRSLQDIDVAFVCMNVPFTMPVDKASSAVRDFRPRVVYPYHYRNQAGSLADLSGFKRQVGNDLGSEVRLRNWY